MTSCNRPDNFGVAWAAWNVQPSHSFQSALQNKNKNKIKIIEFIKYFKFLNVNFHIFLNLLFINLD